MYKSFFFVLVIAVFLFDCCNRSNNVQHTNSEFYINSSNLLYLKIKPNIVNYLDTFINTNYKYKLFEIYFDRVYPHYTIITITSRSQDKDYLLKQHPLMFTIINSDTVWIYSGIEDFAISENNLNEFNFYNEGYYKSLTLKDSMGILSKHINGGMPFLPLQVPISVKKKVD